MLTGTSANATTIVAAANAAIASDDERTDEADADSVPTKLIVSLITRPVLETAWTSARIGTVTVPATVMRSATLTAGVPTMLTGAFASAIANGVEKATVAVQLAPSFKFVATVTVCVALPATDAAPS
jgi:hypothetical protein